MTALRAGLLQQTPCANCWSLGGKRQAKKGAHNRLGSLDLPIALLGRILLRIMRREVTGNPMDRPPSCLQQALSRKVRVKVRRAGNLHELGVLALTRMMK